MKIFYLRTSSQANSSRKWKISPDFPQATVSYFKECLKGKATEEHGDCKCLCSAIEIFKDILLNYIIFVNYTEKNDLKHKPIPITWLNLYNSKIIPNIWKEQIALKNHPKN